MVRTAAIINHFDLLFFVICANILRAQSFVTISLHLIEAEFVWVERLILFDAYEDFKNIALEIIIAITLVTFVEL